MAVEQEILRLQYEVVGANQVERAKLAIDRITKSVRTATQEYRAGTLSQSAFASHLSSSESKIERHRATIDRWATAMGRAKTNSNSLGMGIYQIGQIVEDSQYGFHGIINNINFMAQQAAMAAGKFGPLISGLAALGTIAYVSFKNTDFMEAFGLGLERNKEKTEDLNAALQEVGKTISDLGSRNRLMTREGIEGIGKLGEAIGNLVGRGGRNASGGESNFNAGEYGDFFQKMIEGVLQSSGIIPKGTQEDLDLAKQQEKQLKRLAPIDAAPDDPQSAQRKEQAAEFGNVVAAFGMDAIEKALTAGIATRGVDAQYRSESGQTAEHVKNLLAAGFEGDKGAQAEMARIIGPGRNNQEQALGMFLTNPGSADVAGQTAQGQAGLERAVKSDELGRDLERQASANLEAGIREIAERTLGRSGTREFAEERLKTEAPEAVAADLAGKLAEDILPEDAERFAKDFIDALVRQAEDKRLAEALAVDPRDVERQQLDLMQMAMKDPEAAAMMGAAGMPGMGGGPVGSAEGEEQAQYLESLNLRGASIMTRMATGAGRAGRWAEKHGLTGQGPARSGPGGNFAGAYDAVSTMGAESFAGQVQSQQGGADQAIEQRKKQIDIQEKMEKHLKDLNRLMDRQGLGLTMT